jgi:hypothetical protein
MMLVGAMSLALVVIPAALMVTQGSGTPPTVAAVPDPAGSPRVLAFPITGGASVVAPSATTTHVFTLLNGSVPRVKSVSSSRSIEVGMRFSVSAPGNVIAIRFYKGAGNLGTHVGSLWSSTGRLLARVTFRRESRSGWQRARLSRPVSLRAGSAYVVSYLAPHGHYPFQSRYFVRPRASGPLHATTGRNGLYRFSSRSGFPNQSTRSTNYFVDVEVLTQTTTAVRGCVTKPSGCGFPDATNTGVPAGTALKRVPQDVTSGPGWVWDSRGWVSVTADNAVISGLDISQSIDVNGIKNVTIKNTIVRAGPDDFGISARHTTNLLVEDSTVVGSPGTDRALVGYKDIYGDNTGTVLERLNISGVSTGVQMDSGLLRDSYIHDLGYRSGDHTNGITSNSGGDLLTIHHNTILNAQHQTDAVGLFEDFGAQYNRVISNNLLAGGGYTIYGGANPGGQPTSNIKITNNRISTVYYSQGGYYGPLTAFDTSGTGNVWSGNVWDSTGSPIPY